jgi:predicted TIM-barrel fold metal-dependent hydrolase
MNALTHGYPVVSADAHITEHIYTTFQDDWVAFKMVNEMNWRRLMWASDFPHSDSTWPWSQDVIAAQAAHLGAERKPAILCGNVAELYGIDLASLRKAA